MGDFFQGKMCLVTGGAGFIGSHIVERLLALGCRVRVLDDFSTGRRENLAAFANEIELFEGDIRDEALIADALKCVEYVFHEAALPSVLRSLREPAETMRVNAGGTVTVLEASRRSGVKRFVYASSSSVYGDTPVPKRHSSNQRTEEMSLNPLSPYAASKGAGELYCLAFHEAYGFPVVVLRYFNVFGPRQDPASEYAAVIPKFIARALRGEALEIYGDGEQTRDFTYVDDVVEGNILASVENGAPGKVFNIARGASTSVNELARIITKRTGTDAHVVHVEERKGEVKHSRADISRARDFLGFSPRIALEEGIAKSVEWFSRLSS